MAKSGKVNRAWDCCYSDTLLDFRQERCKLIGTLKRANCFMKLGYCVKRVGE